LKVLLYLHVVTLKFLGQTDFDSKMLSLPWARRCV